MEDCNIFVSTIFTVIFPTTSGATKKSGPRLHVGGVNSQPLSCFCSPTGRSLWKHRMVHYVLLPGMRSGVPCNLWAPLALSVRTAWYQAVPCVPSSWNYECVIVVPVQGCFQIHHGIANTIVIIMGSFIAKILDNIAPPDVQWKA